MSSSDSEELSDESQLSSLPSPHFQDARSTFSHRDVSDSVSEERDEGSSESQTEASSTVSVSGKGKSLPATLSASQTTNASPPSRSSYTAPNSRPNKYRGPASTWRDWTASERELAASLDQLRAKDLSLHLYNSYSLRRHGRDLQGIDKRHARESSSETSPNGKSWAPPKRWAAWPMAPDIVPREEEDWRWESDRSWRNLRKTRKHHSHDILQDILVGQTLKIARETFEQREWEDDQPETQQAGKIQHSRSRSRDLNIANKSDTSEELRPVIMADDQLAKQIMRPSINHVISKLDALLMSLHHARSAYANYDEGSDNSPQSTGDEHQDRKPSLKSHSRSRLRSSSIGLSPDDASERVSDLATDVASKGRQRSKSTGHTAFIKRQARLGLRDWSDVLGVASLIGWDSKAVAKAAARCANLFGEGMTFRTLDEGHDTFSDSTYLPRPLEARGPFPQYTSIPSNFCGPHDSQTRLSSETSAQHPSLKRPANSQLDSDEEMTGAVHVDGFLRPIKRKKSWTRRRKGGETL